jgi:hypothetical protein
VESEALHRWRSERRARIDALSSTLQGDAGASDGEVQAVVRDALYVLLAAEFQGFARELHGEAAGRIAAAIGTTDRLRVLVGGALTFDRRLDHGAPRYDNLRRDFQLLGMALGTVLKAHSLRTDPLISRLKELVGHRNSVAHSSSPTRLTSDRVRPARGTSCSPRSRSWLSSWTGPSERTSASSSS